MSCQLSADCLSEIFEYLEDVDIHSCLLVNRFWCRVSVRFFWKSIKNYQTLITRLPKESRDMFIKKKLRLGIDKLKIPPPPPLFDYETFVQELSLNGLHQLTKYVVFNNDEKNCLIIIQEVLKILLEQITLKTLTFDDYSPTSPCNKYFSTLQLTTYPKAMERFGNLLELN